MLLKPPLLSCGSSCEMGGEEQDCGMEDMECCPPGTCNPGQCCVCCFLCIMDHQKILVKIYQSHFKTIPAGDQSVVSDFTSDCWQPPELA